MVAILAILAFNASYSIYQDYHDTRQRQTALVRAMARVVEDHAYRLLSATDLALGAVRNLVNEVGGLDSFSDENSHARTRLLEIAANFEGTESLVLFDATGRAVAETAQHPARSLNIADRPYFQAAQAGENLHVGPAVIGKLDGHIFFTVSRRLVDPTGRFLGIVSIAIETHRLTDFYDLLGFDLDPLIGIYRANGDVVARRPDMARWVGTSIANGPMFQLQLQQAPSGTYDSISPLDQIERLVAYQTVRDYGLVVGAGIETDVAMAAWRQRAWHDGALAALSALAIALTLGWGWRSLERERRTRSVLARALASRTEVSRKLERARRDPLTGISGRALFFETMEALIKRGQRESFGIAVLFVDLDGFKGVNDRLGHDRGDQVLVCAAQALTSTLRTRDIAGRLGGDEFAACLTGPPDQLVATASLVAQRVVERVGAIGDGIGCSIGIAICPPGEPDAASLLRDADQAMYSAKQAGKNRFVLHAPHGAHAAA